jgi:hypothetical protein
MDCIELKGDIYIVVGTTNNRIYCSYNFIEKNVKLTTERAITCLKLMVDGNHIILIEALEDGYLNFINIE